jgi:DNA-binding beta-propeller fold protein YncE
MRRVTLVPGGRIPLPEHASGGFDHADVYAGTGRVFVAHTANGTVEVIDGEHLALEQTLTGCPEASGVLCTADDQALVFAAARGNAGVLVFNASTCDLLRRIPVGPKPNGLAWDPILSRLLVADVQDHQARLVDVHAGTCVATVELPGRPRWCVYDGPRLRFLVNIREPACVVGLAANTLQLVSRIRGLPTGPHGLDVDRAGERAFVACDAGVVAVLDLTRDEEVARVPIAGEPDAVWYNAERPRLYVAIGQPGVVDVLDGRSLAVVEQISTEQGAHTSAFDAHRQRLYVFLPNDCQAAVYEEIASD